MSFPHIRKSGITICVHGTGLRRGERRFVDLLNFSKYRLVQWHILQIPEFHQAMLILPAGLL
jgi:hypothetical protein